MDNIEDKHQVFGSEVERASWSFYTWKSIDDVARTDKDVLDAIKETAQSWIVIRSSLLTTFLVILGRLFDNNTKSLTAISFLDFCIEHSEQFNADAIRERKIAGNKGVVPEWLDEYMNDIYVPSKNDLENLKKEVSKYKEIYRTVYHPIRNKLIAHLDSNSVGKEEEFFARTDIDQIQGMLETLHQVSEVIWQGLHNGRLNKFGDFESDIPDRAKLEVKTLLESLKS